jgi:hypothetical protein
MEERAEKDKNLKQPVLVNVVQKDSGVATDERCQDVHRHKNCHAQSADPVQDKSQHRTLASVPQALCQADISFQAHRSLLEKLVLGRWYIIPFETFPLKVTILMGY